MSTLSLFLAECALDIVPYSHFHLALLSCPVLSSVSSAVSLAASGSLDSDPIHPTQESQTKRNEAKSKSKSKSTSPSPTASLPLRLPPHRFRKIRSSTCLLFLLSIPSVYQPTSNNVTRYTALVVPFTTTGMNGCSFPLPTRER
jgi:hypothetical protein